MVEQSENDSGIMKVFVPFWGPNVSTVLGIPDRLTLWGQLQCGCLVKWKVLKKIVRLLVSVCVYVCKREKER